MSVVRITANLATSDVKGLAAFYSDLFSLNIAMDLGWIQTLSGEGLAPIHLSVASSGGNGAPVPDLSVEVDNLDAVHAQAEVMGVSFAYPLTSEDWGIRRFMIQDPMGRLINITQHG